MLLFRQSAAWHLFSRSARSLGLAVAVGLGGLGATDVVVSREMAEATPSVRLSSLPVQAQTTQNLILAGGPFPYSKDGTIFANRERVLPSKRRGYYREYTVPTPGSRTRGARRIVCGGQPATQPENCFYTADHYQSFYLIQK